MGYYGITPNLVCTTPVNVSSFVKLDAANPFAVVQCGAGDPALGVTGSATNYPPGVPGATTVCANAGQAVVIYSVGAIVQVQVGAVAVVPGYVKPDANGYAIQANAGDVGSAIVFAPGLPGAFILCQVCPEGQIAGILGGLTAVAINTTLTSANNGETVYTITNPDLTITLPLAAVLPGMTVKVVTGVVTGGSTGTLLAMASGDQLSGNGFTPAANKGALNTHATAVVGDYITVMSLGGTTWTVIPPPSTQGIWARQA
jgi:hypothetical protein